MNVERILGKSLPREIVDLLRRVGSAARDEGVRVSLVGGPVRDLLLGRQLVDLDLVVEGDGIAFSRHLASRLAGEVKSHQRFGTAILVVAPGVKCDVATARRETYARPGALPRVREGGLEEDLRRRDFTINSMAVRLEPACYGLLVDPHGGRRDLRRRHIRVLHENSFRDDPTRLFRAVRFAERFGFDLVEDTERLLRTAVRGRYLDTVSGERIRNEILLMLGEDDPRPAVRRMVSLGLLRALHPDFRPRERQIELTAAGRGDVDLERGEVIRPDRVRLERLLGLVSGMSRGAAAEVAGRLRLSRRFGIWLESLAAARERAVPVIARRGTIARSVIHRALAPYPTPVLRVLAGETDRKMVVRRLEEYLRDLRHVRIRVSGRDLKMMGVAPGPLYRELLDRVLAARLDGEVAGRREELAYLHAEVARRSRRGNAKSGRRAG